MFERQRTFTEQFRWLAVIRGLVAIAAGVLAFVWPGISLIILVYIFAIYSIVNGFLAIIIAFGVRSLLSAWWALFIEGLVGIAIGIITFFWPHITMLALLLLIAVWAALLGIFEVAAAFTNNVPAGERWMVGVAGALSILFALLLFVHPGVGLLTIIWMVGFYTIAWGITLIASALQRHRPPSLSVLEHEQ